MDPATAGDTLAVTRRALHGVAELVLAGPQYRAVGEIKLHVTPGGFGAVVLPIRVDGTDILWDGGRSPLSGTCRSLAATAGLVAGAPGIYADGSGVDLDDPIEVDADVARMLERWFAVGDEACRIFAAEQERILWPEHFDLGISVDEVNYGVSPGDAAYPRPYAYVGPWTSREGDFWNAPFGAVRWADDLPDAAAVADFFSEGRARAAV